MVTTDPIADMLTRIRNAQVTRKDSVTFEASRIKKDIAQILADEGFIASFEEVNDGKFTNIVINLKYGPKGEKVITGLKRISKPGLRIFTSAEEMPKVINGLGIAIVSTKIKSRVT